MGSSLVVSEDAFWPIPAVGTDDYFRAHARMRTRLKLRYKNRRYIRPNTTLGNMKQAIVILATLALGSALGIILEEQQCDRDQCPTPLCADPARVDGQCCETCENSSCRFSGCVHFGAFGPQWYPTPCSLCRCFDGERVCSATICPPLECFGFPLTRDPDACCPRCDWGIAADECAPIPVRNVSLYAVLGDGPQCRREVTMHDCDKRFLLKGGEIRECVGRKRAKPIVMGDCEDIRKIILEDTTQCIVRKPRQPIPDLDLNPKQCDLRV